MRRRGRTVVLGCVVAVLTLAGCSGGDPDGAARTGGREVPAGSTMAEIQQRGELVVGVKYDQPAFGLLNPLTGEPEGFDVELAKIIAKDLTGSAENIRYVEAVTANREAFIEQGKVDMVIASYVVNDKRKQQVSFAGPYYDTGIALMTRKGDRSIRGPEDLAGRPVCVAQGSQAAEAVPERVPSARMSELSTYSYCAQALKDHRVDAMSTSESILIGLEEQNPDELQVIPGHLEPEETAIGFAKDDRELHDYLDALLKRTVRDGRWEQAYRKTVGKVTGTVPKPPKITL